MSRQTETTYAFKEPDVYHVFFLLCIDYYEVSIFLYVLILVNIQDFQFYYQILSHSNDVYPNFQESILFLFAIHIYALSIYHPLSKNNIRLALM